MQPKSEWANSYRVRNEARIEILGGRGGEKSQEIPEDQAKVSGKKYSKEVTKNVRDIVTKKKKRNFQ